MTCIAPDGRGGVCGRPLGAVGPFCIFHAAAPPAQRGGWLSSHRRKVNMANVGDRDDAIGGALDASNVDLRLWVGAFPPVDQRLPAFSMIVLCARELQPERVAWQGKVARVALVDDALEQRELTNAVTAARVVAGELARGGRVLVTCAQGRNRSALVAAMAMLMRNPKMTPAAAIAQVQAKRPHTLTNTYFVGYLNRLWCSRA